MKFLLLLIAAWAALAISRRKSRRIVTPLRSRGVIVRIATPASLFVLVFVAYAHVASWKDARTMMTSPREIHSASAQALANEISPNVSGDLKYEINGTRSRFAV